MYSNRKSEWPSPMNTWMGTPDGDNIKSVGQHVTPKTAINERLLINQNKHAVIVYTKETNHLDTFFPDRSEFTKKNISI